MRRRTHRRLSATVLAAAGSAAGAIILAAPAARAALPTLNFDLRVHDTGGKDATVAKIGDTVTLDLYATLNGLDSDPTNDVLTICGGAFKSSTGGLKGDLLGLHPPVPFDASGFTTGIQQDLDSDGDLDVGGTGTSATGYYAVRQAAGAKQPAGGYFMGQVRFTAGTLTNSTTAVQWSMRPADVALSALYDGALGTSPTRLSGVTLSYGAPVTITGVVDPGATYDYLSGTITDHRSFTRATKVTAGQPLSFTTGFDVQAGGSLDTSDGTGSAAINDATSGNFGGSLWIGPVTIGASAAATFTQSAGDSTTGDITVGGGANAAQLIFSGGTLNAGKLSVGANGVLRHSGGASTFSSVQVDGASVEHSDGTMAVNDGITLSSGSTLTISGGTISANGLSNFAAGSVIRIQGGTFAASQATAAGQIIQSGGVYRPISVTLGGATDADPGAYTITGGTLAANSVSVVPGGVFTQQGGTVAPQQGMSIRGGTQAAPTLYRLQAGAIDTAEMDLGARKYDNNNVRTNIPGMLVQPTGSVTLGVLSVDALGVYSMSGGSLQVSKRLYLEGTLNLNGAAVPVTLNTNCFGDFTLGTIANASNATFTGLPGSLMNFKNQAQLDAVGHISTQGLVHVAGQPLVIPASKSVGGSGTIEGDVTNSGTVAPGNSPGEIDIVGNYAQGSAAALDIELAGTASDQFDLLTVSGSANLAGTLSVSLLDDFVPGPNDSFTFLTAGNLSGAFANAPDHVDVTGGRFDVLYSPTSVTLANFQAVPEPTTFGVLAMAAVGLVRRRRRA